MGLFDLPRGEFDLLLKGKDGKEAWKNVMFCDSFDTGEVADLVEMWSTNYT